MRVRSVLVLTGLALAVGAGAQTVDKSEIKRLWNEGADLYHDGAIPAAVLAWQEAVEKDPANTAIKAKIDEARPELTEHPVVRVIDGNHLVVKFEAGEEPVRLLGVDVAGALPPGITAQQAMEAATANLKQLVDGKNVYVSGASTRRQRDADGSVRGSVYLAPNLTYVNGELIKQGVARAMGTDPYARAGALRAAEAEAQKNQACLWKGYCPFLLPAGEPLPFRHNGEPMVPLRSIVQWLGAKLTVYPDMYLVAADKDLAVKAFADNLNAEINGRSKILERPLIERQSTMFVPVHLVAAAAKGEAQRVPGTGEIWFRYKDQWTLIPMAD